MSYPKWLYHPTKEAVIVTDEAAHKALGAGWVESPADVKPAVDVMAAQASTERPKAHAAHPDEETHPKKHK
jgi:hypothetical protein